MFWKKPVTQLGFTDRDNMVHMRYPSYPVIDYYISSLPIGKRYKRYPDTLVSALSKIGGLLALLKVGILLKNIHQKNFERKVEEELLNKVKKLEKYKSQINEEEETEIESELIESG